ncbi:cobalt ECF transporter T component CbiQ [Pseudodesulfovibrio cashew]|uniref:Cobalt ECF transporter T component CbiQ n=1 Tax=Pseudodesulfovibrio cashew TaxID=2678688 RepID=A0A6I6JJY4_9BACT|nr:cobalt ECF transporter T component CbiQ [Pseudodesulfovibrio cashew]QGY41278.1 cobalt ECF transporter T component CbiQ [Pseudodesulfovibrio cashew]
MAAIDEPFASGDSFIHTVDPRIRLLCAVMLTVPAALFTNMDQACAALAVGFILVSAARLPIGLVVKRLAVVNLFVLFLWLFVPFSLPGEAAFTAGPLAITREGIGLAALISVKSNAVVLGLMALMGTIPLRDLGPALQQLRVPDKLCHILLFTYRYIFVIHQEYLTMRRAMAARGFRPKTNRHTYRSYAWLVGMLLIKSWDRAERVYGAMRCRGFRDRFYSLTTFTSASKDYLFLALCLAAVIGMESLDVIRSHFS